MRSPFKLKGEWRSVSLKAAMRRAEYSGRPPPMPENGKEIQQYGKIKDKIKRRKSQNA